MFICVYLLTLVQSDTNTVTIEIKENCRGVRIITPETPEFFHPSPLIFTINS
jgi:hypothetical protein